MRLLCSWGHSTTRSWAVDKFKQDGYSHRLSLKVNRVVQSQPIFHSHISEASESVAADQTCQSVQHYRRSVVLRCGGRQQLVEMGFVLLKVSVRVACLADRGAEICENQNYSDENGGPKLITNFQD